MKAFFNSPKSLKERAQAIAEFAIVLPILIAILVGILEAGRMVFIYAAVNNASREAVRYASAVGLNNAATTAKYKDCAGITKAARDSLFLVASTTIQIHIYYDDGTNPLSPTLHEYCDGINTYSSKSGDRVTVQVTAHYKPMITLIPFRERDFSSRSSRTILGVLELSYP